MQCQGIERFKWIRSMISNFEVRDDSFKEIAQGYQGELHNGLHNLQVLLELHIF